MRNYGYHYQPPHRPQNNRPLRILKTILFFGVFAVIVLISYSVYRVIKDNLIEKAVISPVNSSVSSSFKKATNFFFPEKLSHVVETSLEGAQGAYAVAIKNLKTGESFYMNEDKTFKSASLYKLWVLGEAYRQIEKGKLDKDKVLTSKVEDINEKFDIASESAELTEGTVTARVTDALHQMIVISNNYAALLLVSQMKLSTVSKFLSDYGFTDSKTGSPPITSARDIASFYEKLYAGLLGSKESTTQMIATLKKQQLNDRIPKYLPDTIDVAHKTGELDGYKHDAGIVYAPKGPYIIVMLSKTNDESIAAEEEAKLSKAVYEYFENK